MTLRRKQMLLIGLTVLAVGAGVVAGMVVVRLPAARSAAAAAPGSAGEGLSGQLGLSAEQGEKMREIWESVRGRVRTSYQDAETLQHRRDEELVAILNPEQRAKFEKISQAYADRFEDLHRRRDQTFADAVERTRKLLSEEQRRKYDEILKSHVRPEQLGVSTMSTTTQLSN